MARHGSDAALRSLETVMIGVPSYLMLGNSASGPKGGLPGRIPAGEKNRPKSGPEARFPERKQDFVTSDILDEQAAAIAGRGRNVGLGLLTALSCQARRG